MILAAAFSYYGFLSHYASLYRPRPINWIGVCPVRYGNHNKRRY